MPLKDANLSIGVSCYTVSPRVPNRLLGQLPNPKQIAALLTGIEEICASIPTAAGNRYRFLNDTLGGCAAILTGKGLSE